MVSENDAKLKDDLESVRAEIKDLLEEELRHTARLAVIRTRVEALRKVDGSISELLGEEHELQAIGITDAIRKVFNDQSIGYKTTPRNIRDALKKTNFPLLEYKNPLAVIHTTLKRLEDQGEIKSSGAAYFAERQLITSDDDIPF